jgi:hypothetical protein
MLGVFHGLAHAMLQSWLSNSPFKELQMKGMFKQAVVASAAAVLSASALAVTVNEGLQPGFNTIQDEDREAYVDVNRNGIVDVGDVFVGFVRMSDFLPSSGSGQPANNQVYGVISNQIVAQTANTVSLGTTTVVGLRLQDLTGNANTAGAMYAIYDRSIPYQDLINLSAPGATSMAQDISYIAANGTLRLTGGIVGGTDFVTPFFTTPSICGPGASTSGIPALTTSITCGNFQGGVSVLYNNTGLVFNGDVPVLDPLTGTITNHQIGIANGAIKGTVGDPQSSVYTNLGIAGFQQCLVNGVNTPCGFNTKADFIVSVAAVPEPASMALVGAALLGLGVARRRRNSDNA